jgi:hypothetical protein
MSTLLDQIKALSKSIRGVKAEDDEEQKLIDGLAKASEEEAEEEVKTDVDAAKTAGDTLAGTLVKAVEFKAFQKQVNSMLDILTIHAEEQEKRVDDLLETEMPKRVDAALNGLLAKVRSTKEIPAAKNTFSETNKPQKTNVHGLKKMQEERVSKHNIK